MNALLRLTLLRTMPALFFLAAAIVPASAEAAVTAGAAAAEKGGAMVSLPAGTYRPLYGKAGDGETRVEAFRLDRDPVTRGEFLAFVRANPEWRRSQVRGVHADRATYLNDWTGDLEAGTARALRLPVTWVSWSAARAFCESSGKRLPTVKEWEYAAAASAGERDASRDPAFLQRLTSEYARRGLGLRDIGELEPNAWGVRGLHEMTWEWVEDFNSVLVSDDSRGVGAREFDQVCASAAIGATDPSNYAAFLRYAVRAGLEGRSAMGSLGFRCAI